MTTAVTDWKELLKLYETGAYNSFELSRMFNVRESTIRKRAREMGIQVERKTIRVADRVQRVLDAESAGKVEITAENVENALVQVGADIVRKHRALIERAVTTVDSLFADLHEFGAKRTAIEQAFEVIKASTSGEEAQAALKALEGIVAKAAKVGARSQAALALSSSLKSLIGLQRQAWNLPSTVTPEGTPSQATTLAQLLDELNGADTGFS